MPEKDKIIFVGYWNGDEEEPIILPELEKGFELVVIEIHKPFRNTDFDMSSSEINKVSSKLKKALTVANKETKKLNKVANKINKLNNIMKRFK